MFRSKLYQYREVRIFANVLLSALAEKHGILERQERDRGLSTYARSWKRRALISALRSETGASPAELKNAVRRFESRGELPAGVIEAAGKHLTAHSAESQQVARWLAHPTHWIP